jgi:hypothetical protein
MGYGVAVEAVGVVDGDACEDGEGDGSFEFEGLEP